MVRDESRYDDRATAEAARDAAPRGGRRTSGSGDAASGEECACGTGTAGKSGFRLFTGDRVLWIIVAALAVIFLLLPSMGWRVAISFVCGATLSLLAGFIGMRSATTSNARTAQAAQESEIAALRTAFTGGSVMGLCVVGLGLFGVTACYLAFQDTNILTGFSLGASLVALFSRVGGGIYTKAADVGADLVGKVEQGIPEDDPRNPAVIADNVGDNVGDVAGMGADLFESYVGAIVSSVILGVVAGGTEVVSFLFLLCGAARSRPCWASCTCACPGATTRSAR